MLCHVAVETFGNRSFWQPKLLKRHKAAFRIAAAMLGAL
jgi:hypothetical protein